MGISPPGNKKRSITMPIFANMRSWIAENNSSPAIFGSDIIAPTLSTVEVGAVADNKIVLTYDEELDTGSVPATGDFTVAGTLFTISTVGVAGLVVTLTLSGDVYDFETITLSYTAGANPIRDLAFNDAANLVTEAVTNTSSSSAPAILADGNAVAWFDAAVANVIKDGSDFVSQMTDKSGSTNHLLQASGTNQPLWSADGVLFDGVDNFMKCVAFTLVQPEFVYFVFKLITWTNVDRIYDGEGSDSGELLQNGVSNEINIFAGSHSGKSTDLALDTFGIVRALYNGASSKFIVNDNTPITGNFGSNDMGGFTLGAIGAAITSFSHVQVKEVIIRKIADAAGDEANIYNYLKSKYGL